MPFNNHFTINKIAELLHFFSTRQANYRFTKYYIHTFCIFFFRDGVSMKKKIYES